MTSLKARELFTPPCQLQDQTDLPRVGFRGAQSAEYLTARGFTLPGGPNQACAQADGSWVARLSQNEYLVLGGPQEGQLGLIRQGNGQTGVLLIDDEADEDLVPVIGSVAAGLPLEAVENHDHSLPVPRGLFSKRPTYLLRVRGESMKDAGILDGDLIAVYKTGIARAGQIVIARIDNEVTVKYLDYEKKMVKLVPANPTFEPQLISPDKVVIEGVFVGLIRDSFVT